MSADWRHSDTLFYFSGIAVMTLLYAQHDTMDGGRVGAEGPGTGAGGGQGRDQPVQDSILQQLMGRACCKKTVPY